MSNEYRRAFLYAQSANVATAQNLLEKRGIQYSQGDSIQDGITELSFSAAETFIRDIASEILNNQIPVHFTDTKLPITGTLGSITTTIDSPTSVAASKSVSVTTTAAALAAAACQEVTLLADSANTNPILVGNASEQAFPLAAGASLTLKVANANAVYVKVAAGTETLKWVAT